MKPVSVVKIYTTNFFHRFVFTEKLISVEKTYCNESQKSVSQQLLFDVSLFKFHFVSAFQYLDCYYNEYLVKQTA